MIKQKIGIVVCFLLLSTLIPVITSIESSSSGKTWYVEDYTIININIENGSLSGYVRDTLGNLIENTVIDIKCSELHMQNVSDSTGFYYIGNVPIVDCYWNVSASKNGYRRFWIEMSIDENTTYDFVLTPEDKTWYVDDNGGADFTKIQDAINASVDGDTIYVYSGVYYEHLTITNSIILYGENKNTTIIDSNLTNGDTIEVYSDGVTIKDFTITRCGKQYGDSGIKLHSKNNIIINNIICKNGWKRYYYKQGGLYLNNSSYNYIANNTILNNREAGIYLHHSNNNTIFNNIITDNSALAIISNASSYNEFSRNDLYENFCGMTFWPYSTYNKIEKNYVHDHPGCGIAFKAYSDNNVINNNLIENNLEWGIMLGFGPTKSNIIEYNTITGTIGGSQNWFDGSGLVVSIAFLNTIRYNNFIGNRIDVYLENSILNIWNYNYWENHSGNGIKIIKGHIAQPYIYHPEKQIPWLAIDWKPANEPYDIS